jgi:cyclohexa-1,5-dienecarbonyl-CoA hydratase
MSRTHVATHVHVERDGAVARVVLDRPPLNVLNLALLQELQYTLETLAGDCSLKALVLTGAGRAFCAGVDVADHTPDRVPQMLSAFHSVVLDLLEFPTPVVAMVNGAALGGGCELLLACDVVIARQGAKLGLPEIRLGAFPPFAAVVLPGLVGRQTALDLILSGRTFGADVAFELGLVQQVAPAENLDAVTADYVRQLSASSASVLRLAKRAVLDAQYAPIRDALAQCEATYRDELMALADAREGIVAFLEKREPVWEEC